MDMYRKPKEDQKYFPKFNQNIDELRRDGELVDIKLKVKLKDGSEQRYQAHKFVLACASLHFRKLFQDLEKAKSEGKSNSDTLEIKPTCKHDCFSLILDYFYTSKVHCTIENVLCLYEYSEDFQLKSLRSMVIEFMQNHLDLNTWLSFWRFSEKKNIAVLAEDCETFYVQYLEKILEQNLEKLELEELSKIVKNSKINLEETHSKVSKYIIRWIQIDEKIRIHDLFGLTEWDKDLKWDAILYLCDDPSRGLKQYVNQLTFKNLHNLCIEKKTTSDKKILFTCITNWTYSNRDERTQNFLELLQLIDFPSMESEFVRRQISNERLIYENISIKEWLEKELNSSRIESTVECKIITQDIYLVSLNTIFNVDQRKKTLTKKFPYEIRLDFGFAAIPTIDNKYIFMLSGANFYNYSREDNKFKQLAPMAELRSLHNMIQFNNKIYSCGGSMGDLANIRTVEEYDMERNEWFSSDSMNEGRYLYKMEKHSNSILVVGGKGETFKGYNVGQERNRQAIRGCEIFRLDDKGDILTLPPPMERYDPREGKWKRIEESRFPDSSENYFSFLCEDSINYYGIEQEFGKKFDLRMNRWLNINLDFPKGLNMPETKYIYSCCTKPIYVAAINKFKNNAEAFEFNVETEIWTKDEEFSIPDFPQIYTSNLLGFINKS